MPQFADREHTITEAVFVGTTEFHADAAEWAAVAPLVSGWNSADPKPGVLAELFGAEDLQAFALDYQGQPVDYWPDERTNFLHESLLREFLFHDGVCQLNDFEPRLYRVTFKVLTEQDADFLLVLPYSTDSGNVAGICVVCVNHRVQALLVG